MAIDEQSRHELHLRLEEALGPQAAGTLMSHLPPVGWADVATKSDLDALSVATKRDLDALEERMDLRFAAVEQRMDLRFAAVEERMDLRFQAASHEMVATVERAVGGLRSEMNSQLRTMVFAVIATNFTAVSLAFAAARLH